MADLLLHALCLIKQLYWFNTKNGLGSFKILLQGLYIIVLYRKVTTSILGFKDMNLMKIIIFLQAFNSQMENQFKQMEELIMRLQDVNIIILEL